MELIKIENIDQSLLSEETHITEAQCDELLSSINNYVSAPNSKRIDIPQSITEGDSFLAKLAVAGSAAVLIAIAAIRKWIKTKYSLTAKRIIDQSKELNDIYTKVSDLLANDKMARFKHRNDTINTYVKYCILIDKQDPRKLYNPVVDLVAYNPEYFINEINDIMKYVDTQSKDKTADLNNMKQSLLNIIDTNFQKDHWFVEQCSPSMRVEPIHGARLETAIMNTKETISNIYNIVYMFNRYIAAELQYTQLLEKAYTRMISLYSKNPDGKAVVDEVFKKLIKNTATSLDFNNDLMTIYEEEIKWYDEEFERFYKILKQ